MQEQTSALQAEYEAKIKSLKGLKESARPESMQQAHPLEVTAQDTPHSTHHFIIISH